MSNSFYKGAPRFNTLVWVFSLAFKIWPLVREEHLRRVVGRTWCALRGILKNVFFPVCKNICKKLTIFGHWYFIYLFFGKIWKSLSSFDRFTKLLLCSKTIFFVCDLAVSETKIETFKRLLRPSFCLKLSKTNFQRKKFCLQLSTNIIKDFLSYRSVAIINCSMILMC